MTVPDKESINPKVSYDTHDNSGVAAAIHGSGVRIRPEENS